MIIEFSATNFRSIRGRCTLSLVASNQISDLPGSAFDISVPGLKSTRLLTGAGIYGANASGKSNVLKAVNFMQRFILDSATQRKPGDSIGRTPFALDSVSERMPTTFEIVFVASEVRYEYGFSLDNRRIHEEWLRAFPKGVPQNWYSRRLPSPEADDYEWKTSPTNFSDDKDLRIRTREDNLFLSVAAQFNHSQLSPLYKWFQEGMRVLFLSPEEGHLLALQASNLIEANPALSQSYGRIMRWADLGINGIRVESRPFLDSELPPSMPKEVREYVHKTFGGERTRDVLVLHTRNGEAIDVAFRLEDESAGTQRLFALLAPWLKALTSGSCLFVDELGSSMHPLMTRKLLALFGSRDFSEAGAQIVFTTHDTTLLDRNILRRDQVWFTEKDKAGATELYSLNDFHPRKEEALGRGYLAGRYGAIPFLTADLEPWR